MNANDDLKFDKEDLRNQYSNIVEYHNSLVNIRFTIAGLYVAGMGVLAGFILGNDVAWLYRIAGSGLAIWLTLCLWILELRSRALYTNLAYRGIEIEHYAWQLVGNKWYDGFFSHQYKIPPKENETNESVPKTPDPDCPRFGWSKKTLSTKISKHIKHSLGLDLLYSGGGVFWLVTLILSILKFVKLI